MQFRQMLKEAPFFIPIFNLRGRPWVLLYFCLVYRNIFNSFHKFDLFTDAAGKCSYIEFLW